MRVKRGISPASSSKVIAFKHDVDLHKVICVSIQFVEQLKGARFLWREKRKKAAFAAFLIDCVRLLESVTYFG